VLTSGDGHRSGGRWSEFTKLGPGTMSPSSLVRRPLRAYRILAILTDPSSVPLDSDSSQPIAVPLLSHKITLRCIRLSSINVPSATQLRSA
jgi:hypothetical protein